MGNEMIFSGRSLLASLLVIGLRLCALCQQTGAVQTPFVGALPDPAPSVVEHWDELSILDSHFHPNPPIPGQTDTFPEFTRELLRVQWRAGDPIDLYIVRPAGISKPPVILYLYGYPGEA